MDNSRQTSTHATYKVNRAMRILNVTVVEAKIRKDRSSNHFVWAMVRIGTQGDPIEIWTSIAQALEVGLIERV